MHTQGSYVGWGGVSKEQGSSIWALLTSRSGQSFSMGLCIIGCCTVAGLHHYMSLVRRCPGDVTTQNVSDIAKTTPKLRNTAIDRKPQPFCSFWRNTKRRKGGKWLLCLTHDTSVSFNKEPKCWWSEKINPTVNPTFPEDYTTHINSETRTSNLSWLRDNCYQKEMGWRAERRKKEGRNLNGQGWANTQVYSTSSRFTFFATTEPATKTLCQAGV